MSPLFLEKRKARGNPGELLGAGGSKSWAERDGYEGAGSRHFSPRHSCPQRRGALCPGSPVALQCSYCWRGDAQGFWPRAPVAQTATPTSAPFTTHKAGSSVRDLPTEQGWGWCSASPAPCKALTPPPTLASQPISLVLYTAPTSLPDACSLSNLSAQRYFSGLHHSSQTQILNIFKYNRQVSGCC